MNKEIKNIEEKLKWTKPELKVNKVMDTEGKDRVGFSEYATSVAPS